MHKKGGESLNMRRDGGRSTGFRKGNVTRKVAVKGYHAKIQASGREIAKIKEFSPDFSRRCSLVCDCV